MTCQAVLIKKLVVVMQCNTMLCIRMLPRMSTAVRCVCFPCSGCLIITFVAEDTDAGSNNARAHGTVPEGTEMACKSEGNN